MDDEEMEDEEVTLLALNQENELNMRILRAARKEEEELRLKSRQLWRKGEISIQVISIISLKQD